MFARCRPWNDSPFRAVYPFAQWSGLVRISGRPGR
jgi:hypothetical protein